MTRQPLLAVLCCCQVAGVASSVRADQRVTTEPRPHPISTLNPGLFSRSRPCSPGVSSDRAPVKELVGKHSGRAPFELSSGAFLVAGSWWASVDQVAQQARVTAGRLSCLQGRKLRRTHVELRWVRTSDNLGHMPCDPRQGHRDPEALGIGERLNVPLHISPVQWVILGRQPP
jgi:hypothetical protein